VMGRGEGLKGVKGLGVKLLVRLPLRIQRPEQKKKNIILIDIYMRLCVVMMGA
jgi:hypothetical protein